MTSWDGGTLDEREYLIVRGTVQQIVYYNDENGYAVLRLAAENGAEVTATGTFPNIGLGEEVILTGCWVTHPTYGEQFATEAFERRLPTPVRGVLFYSISSRTENAASCSVLSSLYSISREYALQMQICAQCVTSPLASHSYTSSS